MAIEMVVNRTFRPVANFAQQSLHTKLKHSPTLFSTGTESDDTINPDFDTMDIVDISFLDCRDMNVDEYRGDNLSEADSDSNDEDHWKNDYPDEVRAHHMFSPIL